MSGELVVNIILLCVFLIFFAEAQRIPRGLIIESVQREVGADFWPKTLLVILILLMVILIIKSLIVRKRKEAKGEKPHHEKENWKGWLLVVFMVVIFIVAQYFIGFLITLIIFIATILYLMGWKKKISLVIISLFLAFLFTITFGRFLHVPFHKGMGIFRSISQIFY